jgi:hypothetical protein
MRTSDFERGDIAQVNAVGPAATEDVHDVVDESGGMAFAGSREIANALELCPAPEGGIEYPGVIEMLLAVGSSKPNMYQRECEWTESPTYTSSLSPYMTMAWPVRGAGLSESESTSSQAALVRPGHILITSR